MSIAIERNRVSLDEAADRFVRSQARQNTGVRRQYWLAMDEMKKFARERDIVELEAVAEMSLAELAVWAEAAGQRIAPEEASFEAARRSLEIADIFFRWAKRRGYLNDDDKETESSKSYRRVTVGVGS